MTDDLITWLRAQLDDDERAARAVEGIRQPWYFELIDDAARPLVELALDPARVLAEVDAKRRILDVYQADVIDVSRRGGPPEWMHGAVPVEAHTVLRLLTLPYADRPGYRDEWKP